MSTTTDLTGRRQWAIVRRAFMRRKLPMLGLAIVGLLLATALLAPLLANDKPVIARWKGKLYFPAFTTYLDAYPVPKGVASWLRRQFHLLSPVYPALEGRSWKEAIAADRGAQPEEVDWHLIMHGESGWAIMPPVPYGFRENSPGLVKLRPGDPRLAGTRHWLGTDNLGRDVLARMIYGSIVAVAVGVLSVAIYVAIGVVLGSIAGYCGGVADALISRLIEVVICFPVLFLILAVVAVFGPSIYPIIVLLGLILWTGPARLIRGELLKAKTLDWVLAARALGLPAHRILFRHLVPNCLAPVLVSATFGVAGAILIESSLSFLGFGVAPPMASWGEIGRQGRLYVSEGLYHLILYPGLATFVTVTAVNLVGEGLRDAMDPRLRT